MSWNFCLFEKNDSVLKENRLHRILHVKLEINNQFVKNSLLSFFPKITS